MIRLLPVSTAPGHSSPFAAAFPLFAALSHSLSAAFPLFAALYATFFALRHCSPSAGLCSPLLWLLLLHIGFFTPASTAQARQVDTPPPSRIASSLPGKSISETVSKVGTPLHYTETSANELELVLSTEEAYPGDTVRVIFEGHAIEQLQYFGAELAYDTQRLLFLEAMPGSIFPENPVFLAQHLPDSTLGVSISSTSGEVTGLGPVLELCFEVRPQASAGPLTFDLRHSEASDADNQPLSYTNNPEAAALIPPYITDAGLLTTTPPVLGRGETEALRLRAVTEGITPEDITPDGSVTAQIGLLPASELPGWDPHDPHFLENPDNIDPDSWPESAWFPLTYTESDADSHFYHFELPADLEIGTWIAAGRFQLDERPYLYADYLEQDAVFQHLTITITPQRVLLAHWSFDREDWDVDTGVYANLPAPSGSPEDAASGFSVSNTGFSLVNAGFNGWITGSPGRAPNSNGWHPEAAADSQPKRRVASRPDNRKRPNTRRHPLDSGTDQQTMMEKFWHAALSGSGFERYRVDFKMTGSGTGPRDFTLQYRDGDTPWQAVPKGGVEVGSSFSEYRIMLPESAADIGSLQVRWLQTGETSINGGDISSAGTNRIDEVRISGVPRDDTPMQVMPGDASFSGVADESDVLSVAHYWMARGPVRIPQSIQWAPQSVISWVPAAAGHADTNGDGIVDYRDVMAIGRNFQLTHSHASAKIAGSSSGSASGSSSGPASGSTSGSKGKWTIPALSKGTTVTIQLTADEPVTFTGLSSRFRLEGLAGQEWSLSDLEPAAWADPWASSGRLLRFVHDSRPSRDDGLDPVTPRWSAAWAHKGAVQPVKATHLLELTLTAEEDWPESPELVLDHLRFLQPDGTMKTPSPESLRLTSNDEAFTDGTADPEVPVRVHLYQNYPNPFNPGTVITYDIPDDSHVRVAVYDMLGRRIAVLVDREQSAGHHTVTWDASQAASGVYLYRLESGQVSLSRNMTLVR